MLVQNLIRFCVKRLRQCLAILGVIFLLCHNTLVATPQLSQYDPAVIHTFLGTDKFYKERKKADLVFNFSPFYQHTRTATQQVGDNFLNGLKSKVAFGNMLGRWNMLALYYNPADTIPSGSPLSSSRTRILAAEANAGLLAADSVTESTGKNFNPNITCSSTDTVNAVITTDSSLAGTIEKVEATYERLGLRGQLSFDFAFGLGMTLKGGLVDYRLDPHFVPFVTGTPSTTATTANSCPTYTSEPAQTIFKELTAQNQIEAIAKQFDLDLCEQRITTFEDTHVDVHWCIPIKRYDAVGDWVYTLAPYFSVGVWVPTGVEKDQNKAFSVPTGNDGFTGVTVETSLNFDFPKMFQLGFGGGGAFFGTRTLTCYRMPTSEYQVGIIPWKTTICKQPGCLWYFNLSMKAENFEPGFSFYFDYIFTQHTRDRITLNESNPARLAAFEKGLDHVICTSSWRAQNFNAAIKYDITSACSLSLGVQGYISGIRTYRITTMMGTFSVAL